MKLYLGHISGLEYWTMVALGKLPVPKPTRVRTLSQCAVSAQEIRRFDVGQYGVDTCTLDVLVPARCANTRLPAIRRWRVREPLPAGSLYQIEPSMYVCSPELIYSHVAALLSTADLVLLGYELCGRYALCNEVEKGFVKRPPITTAAKLLLCSQRLTSWRGVGRARLAASCVQDGSESPMESKLAIQQCAPVRLGGFNLRGASLNEEVVIRSRSASGWKTSTRRCDLLWKDKGIAVEYDSSAYHESIPDINRDALRRNQLVQGSYTVITVTKQQVYSAEHMLNLARILAKLLDVRLRIRACDFEERRSDLRRSLFKPDDKLLRPKVHRANLPFWH